LRLVSGVGPEIAPDPGATVVAESRVQIGFMPALLVLLCGLALGRGVAGAQTSAGRVAAAVVFSALIVVIVWGWIYVALHPSRLEVAENAITLRPRRGQVATLSRQQGDELQFFNYSTRLGRFGQFGLAIVGTGSALPVRGFWSRKQVRQACLARGWRVDN
jgi:hypothetical protein